MDKEAEDKRMEELTELLYGKEKPETLTGQTNVMLYRLTLAVERVADVMEKDRRDRKKNEMGVDLLGSIESTI